MTWATYLIVIAATFAVLFLGDMLFRKFFRKEHEYQTGMVVHLNKRYLVTGILLVTLGVAVLPRALTCPMGSMGISSAVT